MSNYDIRRAQISAGEDFVTADLRRKGLIPDHAPPMLLLTLANVVASKLPLGYTLSIRIERGSAWVELTDPLERQQRLPDAADKTIDQQVNDALCVACGWPA